MKKLFNISKEEKSRILNLHEGATKRQYLKETFFITLNQGSSGKINNTPISSNSTPIEDTDVVEINGSANATTNDRKKTTTLETGKYSASDILKKLDGFNYRPLKPDKPTLSGSQENEKFNFRYLKPDKPTGY